MLNEKVQESTEQISELKKLILAKGLCDKVREYINTIKGFKLFLGMRSVNVLASCELKRKAAHDEILAGLGCSCPMTREYCQKCPDICVKFAFVLLMESKEQEICKEIELINIDIKEHL